MEKEAFMSASENLPDIGVTVDTCEIPFNFGDPTQFHKLEPLERFGITVDSFIQLLPNAAVANSLLWAYHLRFPEGVEGTLMKLDQGGFASTIIGSNKKIAGSASLFPLDKQAALFTAFSLISFVTGQYFLSNISSELSLVNQKLDAVLDFLESEKYAALLSELEFVQHAVKNYLSIMLHEPQRVAMLTNIQRSKTQSIADIYFYMRELKRETSRAVTSASSIENAQKRLDLACQLYTISTIMEVYYSQNFEQAYIDDILEHSDKLLESVSKRKLQYFTDFAAKSQKKSGSTTKAEKIVQSKWDILIEDLASQTKDPLVKVIEDAFSKLNKQCNLYVLQNGDIYQQIN